MRQTHTHTRTPGPGIRFNDRWRKNKDTERTTGGLEEIQTQVCNLQLHHHSPYNRPIGPLSSTRFICIRVYVFDGGGRRVRPILGSVLPLLVTQWNSGADRQ